MMKNSLDFSLQAFSPILVLLLPPALVLASFGLLNLILAISSDLIPLTSSLRYCLWGIGPILFSILLIWSGKACFEGCQPLLSYQAFQIVIWVVFTLALFLTLWFDLTLIGSISASDKPLSLYLRATGLMAGILTMVGQVAVLPWLRFVLSNFPEQFNPQIDKEG
jgi:hypothetical protein